MNNTPRPALRLFLGRDLTVTSSGFIYGKLVLVLLVLFLILWNVSFESWVASLSP